MEAKTELVLSSLEIEFDKIIAEMKPYILAVSQKSERQKCARWIKKLCEPTGNSVSVMKNRNLYAKLLLQMLTRNKIDRPFHNEPQSGPLPALSSDAYSEDELGDSSRNNSENKVPDWVCGELAVESRCNPDSYQSFGATRQTFNSIPIEDWRLNKGEANYRKESMDIESRNPSSVANNNGLPERSNKLFSYDPHPSHHQVSIDWDLNGAFSSDSTMMPRFHDQFDLSHSHNNEQEIRLKMMEARFQEQALKIQHKHDGKVQEIYNRKNAEIASLEQRYKKKCTELEGINGQLEKKLAQFQHEVTSLKESKDQQLHELKRINDETCRAREAAFEKKMSDLLADFDREKFELQKQQTQSIEELMNDTNLRLARMENEYRRQMETTSSVIKELEGRVHQLSVEADTIKHARGQLEKCKADLEMQVEKLHSELDDAHLRFSMKEMEMKKHEDERSLELRTFKCKSEAAVDFLKQDHMMAMNKASETIAELDQCVAQLRIELECKEQQRQKELKMKENERLQEKQHLEHLNVLKVKSLQQQLQDQEQEFSKKVRKLEQTLREKENEIQQLNEEQVDHVQHVQKTLDQVERDSNKINEDLKQQVMTLESKLNRSKNLREKQSKEFQRQLDDAEKFHKQTMAEMVVKVEQEKTRLWQEFQSRQEAWLGEREKELDVLRESHRGLLAEIEMKANERTEADSKRIEKLEEQVRQLHEEKLEMNHVHKNQIIELGLARDEERTKIEQSYEVHINRLHSQMEMESVNLKRKHNEEMEKLQDITTKRLKELEKDFSLRSAKSNETVRDLQRTIDALKDDQQKQREELNRQLEQLADRFKEEKRQITLQHSSELTEFKEELDRQQSDLYEMERKLTKQQLQEEEKVTYIRSQYEEKLRGMMPTEVRQELENTIQFLKSQIVSLQQRVDLLQEDLNTKRTNPPATPFNATPFNVPLKSSS